MVLWILYLNLPIHWMHWKPCFIALSPRNKNPHLFHWYSSWMIVATGLYVQLGNLCNLKHSMICWFVSSDRSSMRALWYAIMHKILARQASFTFNFFAECHSVITVAPKRYNIINTTKGNTHNTCNKQTNNEKNMIIFIHFLQLLLYFFRSFWDIKARAWVLLFKTILHQTICHQNKETLPNN